MRISLQYNSDNPIDKSITITGSKSETNRALILSALFDNITIKNHSNSEDSILMKNALKSQNKTINIYHAGTAMRFLTAFFANYPNRETILTGSDRMKQRPIKPLVDALITLGGNISYLEKKGFPPIQINGKKLSKNEVTLNGNISSQYITALLLIAPTLKKGLRINITNKLTSKPYVNMSLKMLHQIGINYQLSDNTISISPISNLKSVTFTIESDWSSASYYFSFVALCKINTKIQLTSYKPYSLQGDSGIIAIYKKLGVNASFKSNILCLEKVALPSVKHLKINFTEMPDIAQTVTITCLGLNITCSFTGLHTLKIKETDRLQALKNEIQKLGTSIDISSDQLVMSHINSIYPNVTINTYNDHRMAMAFAPLVTMIPISIDNCEVVTKSYPDFWKDFKKLGVTLKK